MSPFAHIPEVGDLQEDTLKGLENFLICHLLKPSLCPTIASWELLAISFSPSKSLWCAPHFCLKNSDTDKYLMDNLCMWISI